jgi:hypothetical protein
MPQTFKIDQAATFSGVVLLSIEPKPVFGSDDQDRTTDGVPKWEAQVAAGFRQFGRTVNEVLKIGLVSHANPADGLTPYQPVQLVDFEVGVMPQTRTNKETGEEKITGVQVWYRCAEIRPLSAVGTRGKLHEVVSGSS